MIQSHAECVLECHNGNSVVNVCLVREICG
jgi:hypothetical protein